MLYLWCTSQGICWDIIKGHNAWPWLWTLCPAWSLERQSYISRIWCRSSNRCPVQWNDWCCPPCFKISTRQLSIGLVSQFVLDPMHLVYLGVLRKLIGLWMKGPIAANCRIGGSQVRAISALLVSFHAYIPHEFPTNADPSVKSIEGKPLNSVNSWFIAELLLWKETSLMPSTSISCSFLLGYFACPVQFFVSVTVIMQMNCYSCL